MSTEDNQDLNEPKIDGVPVFLPDNLKAMSFSNNINMQFAPEEFAIDFLNMNSIGGAFVARVALTPSHMKRFVNVAMEQVKLYEEMFGEIPDNIEPKK